MRTVQATPRSLWRAWRTKRDAGAFESLVEPEIRYAAALARRMGASAPEAEDVVQDSLIRLAKEKSDDPVRVGVRARLIKRPKRNIVSSLNADAQAEVTPLTLDNIIAGFDQSLQDVMAQVVEWSLKTGVGA